MEEMSRDELIEKLEELQPGFKNLLRHFGDVPVADRTMYDDIHHCEEDPDLP